MPELKKGYQGPLYYPWYDWAVRYAPSYSFLLGSRDGYFGDGEASFVREMQRRAGIVIDGKFGDRTAAAVNYKWPGTSAPPVVQKRRKIWLYSSPGSGADYWWGPSFELGERCKNILHINHQPVKFDKGGYLGALGGDPTFSYVEVTWSQCRSLEWLLDNNPDAQEAMRLAEQTCIQKQWQIETLNDSQLIEIARLLEFEFHASGYSQSADGLEDALEYLLGDPGFIHPGDKAQTLSKGKYRLLRHCLKLVVQFGNPSTKNTGIARKVRPLWLDAKIRNVNKPNDFYAVVPAIDGIRPAFYAVIIQAEMELPFFVHILRVSVPIIMSYIPILGFFGPLGQIAVAGMSGLNAGLPLFGSLFGMAGSQKDTKVDQDLINLLSPTGILQNIPGLIGLIGALPGLQAHGEYGPIDVDTAYGHIAGFRR